MAWGTALFYVVELDVVRQAERLAVVGRADPVVRAALDLLLLYADAAPESGLARIDTALGLRSTRRQGVTADAAPSG